MTKRLREARTLNPAPAPLLPREPAPAPIVPPEPGVTITSDGEKSCSLSYEKCRVKVLEIEPPDDVSHLADKFTIHIKDSPPYRLIVKSAGRSLLEIDPITGQIYGGSMFMPLIDQFTFDNKTRQLEDKIYVLENAITQLREDLTG